MPDLSPPDRVMPRYALLSRPIPGSLRWLIALIVLALATALASGGVLYWETHRLWRIEAQALTRGADPQRGRRALYQYGCGGCHDISGIHGASGMVGPDLTHMGRRTTLAGSYANDPDTMVRWLMYPQAMRPGSGMPDMGVSERDARDMAAYLYAHR